MISDGLLRPVTRKRLFLQITAAMGQEMLDVWLGLCIGLVASWLILGASNLHEPVAWASLVAAGGFIALAGGGLAYLMGTHLEAGRSLASCLWIVATLLAWGVMTDLSKTAWSCLGWGAGALLVGASLMAAAYRRWLRVDWD